MEFSQNFEIQKTCIDLNQLSGTKSIYIYT